MDLSPQPIQVVAQRTGLSAHVIRIWEKRYGAVQPERTASNRRLYSEQEINRLSLLRRLTEAGQSIGYIAKLPTSTLQSLIEASVAGSRPALPREEESADALLQAALDATRALDGPGLDALLERAEVRLGAQGVLRKLIGPFATSLGERWRSGDLTAAHEHFATASLRLFLAQAARPLALGAYAPLLVVATPAGQLHELGALLVSATAANLGWRVLYLGPSLSAADLAGAVIQNNAKALALSIVYPSDDAALSDELILLRRRLPHTPLILGGRAVDGYRSAIAQIDAHVPNDLSALGEILDNIRSAPPAWPRPTP